MDGPVKRSNIFVQLYTAKNRRRRLQKEMRKNVARLKSAIGLRQTPFEVQKHAVGMLLLDRSSLVDRSILDVGYWEDAQLDRLQEAFGTEPARDKAIFLDIGAYWGLYAMHAHRAGIGEIHVFEPDPRNRSQLFAQLFLNSLVDDITVHPIAAHNTKGKVSFRRSQEITDGNRGSAGIVSNDIAETFEVDCCPIDDVLQCEGRMIFCKMDVEGAELQALDGMRTLIAQNKIFLQIEVFDENREAYRPYLEDLGLRFLERIKGDEFYQNF